MESFPSLTGPGEPMPGFEPVTPNLNINPPIFNSSCPWATSYNQLRDLLECPSTGAITTRTSLLRGFPHNPRVHRFAFFNSNVARNQDSQTYSFPEEVPEHSDGMTNGGHDTPVDARTKISYSENVLPGPRPDEWSASMNNLGYSPIPLHQYMEMLKSLGQAVSHAARRKYAIISVTGTEDELIQCYNMIVSYRAVIPFQLAMEVNLSCPNISGSSPLAYDRDKLASYVKALPAGPAIPVGIKVPPYTYMEQFLMLKSALVEAEADTRLTFITATNTLGNCFLMEDGDQTGRHTLPNGGFGGMAGSPLHPLALGNVQMLDEHVTQEELRFIEIIGVGGVYDGKSYHRMRSMGAGFVGLATALGKAGSPQIFVDIENQIAGEWEEWGPPMGPEDR